MKSRLNLAINAVAAVILSVNFAVGQSHSKSSMLDSLQQASLWIDSVSSGGWKFEWSSKFMLAINDTTQSVDTLFVNQTVPESDTTDYFYYEDYRVLSIVGPYVSWSCSYNGSGGAHPIAGTYYETHAPGSSRQISLTELFPEGVIERALLADTLIQAHLTKKDPKDLADLVDNLHGGCAMELQTLLTSFAVNSIDRDSVTIDFGITHGCELMRGNFTEFTIRLPIPKDDRQMFIDARRNHTIGW
ncbi:MAG: hypothetical protein M1378_02590 [Bacteroidetes bacterium]|nr:hypothetical protein [Bacteroidota bacterium]